MILKPFLIHSADASRLTVWRATREKRNGTRVYFTKAAFRLAADMNPANVKALFLYESMKKTR